MPTSKPTAGLNDLASLFPAIAAEAYGWDPTTVRYGSSKTLTWRCPKGHLYDSKVAYRTGKKKQGCTICSGKTILSGFNDLATLFPEVAKEADGWDPSNVSRANNNKFAWKCKLGHKWEASVNNRTCRKSGCPYCAYQKVLPGFNDLATHHPVLATEAHGWEPEYVLPGSNAKLEWQCKRGHIFIAKVNKRTGTDKTGCPYCSNKKCLPGFNDLQTLFPTVAAEAFGWDPKMVIAGSHERLNWRCQKGHVYTASVSKRTFSSEQTGCPYCSNQKLLIGFNDLRSTHPDIAAQAQGWDPTTVTSGAVKRLEWICDKGHTWRATAKHRTGRGQGCPDCAKFGFDRSKPAWLYLMSRPGEQQFGITNNLEERISYHERFGWQRCDILGPYSGNLILSTETALKKWLRLSIGVIPGTQENWETSRLEVYTIPELLQQSGISTNLI